MDPFRTSIRNGIGTWISPSRSLFLSLFLPLSKLQQPWRCRTPPPLHPTLSSSHQVLTKHKTKTLNILFSSSQALFELKKISLTILHTTHHLPPPFPLPLPFLSLPLFTLHSKISPSPSSDFSNKLKITCCKFQVRLHLQFFLTLLSLSLSVSVFSGLGYFETFLHWVPRTTWSPSLPLQAANFLNGSCYLFI